MDQDLIMHAWLTRATRRATSSSCYVVATIHSVRREKDDGQEGREAGRGRRLAFELHPCMFRAKYRLVTRLCPVQAVCKSDMVIVATFSIAHASLQAQQPPLLPCLMSNTQHKLGGADLPSVPQRCT